jgi:hypothetical protein
MRRSRRVFLLLGCTLSVLGCAKAKAPSAAPGSATSVPIEVVDEDPVDPESGYEASCMFAKRVAHPDGASLIREFLERDGRGDFLRSDDWFGGATDCPGHEPGPDTYILIADQQVQIVRSGDSLIFGVVKARVLGLVGPGSRFSDTLLISPRSATDTLRAFRTRFGWRIRSPALRQHVLLSSQAARGVRDQYGDTLRKLGYAVPGEGR